MAVKCNSYIVLIDKLVNSLVVGKIIGFEEVMYNSYIRQMPGPVNRSAIDCLHLNDPIRIMRGQRQRGTIKIDNHP